MGYFNGTPGGVVKASANFGGALVVFEGQPTLLVGGFNFDMNDLPAVGDVLPCGTPVYCDEASSARSITPIITGKVASVDGTTVVLADNGFGQTPFKVGDIVGALGNDLTAAVTYTATITAKDGNTLTLSAAVTGLSADDILVQLNSTTSKPKAVPNALLPYDVVRGENEISRTGDGMYANERPVLERRMPAINSAIKSALAAAGCTFKFSDRK